MSNRANRQSGKNRRVQTPKGRNVEWAKAQLDLANRNNTMPSGTLYKRKPKHKEF